MGKGDKMKRLFIILIPLFIGVNSMLANPIILFYFSEVLIDTPGWKIELHLNHVVGSGTLDGWYLKTNSSTAYFKTGIVLDTNYLVITQDSLTGPLIFNRSGDNLELHTNQGVVDQISFGDSGSVVISAPRPGESICFREYRDEFQRWIYYLDNTPTIGWANDTLNAMGNIGGVVTDTAGSPLKNAKVVYGYTYQMGFRVDIYVLTDSAGRFIIHAYALLIGLTVSKDGYKTISEGGQIWPDSTADVAIVLQQVVGVNFDYTTDLFSSFKLAGNYPNPFNPSTYIKFSLPEVDFAVLRVYDLLGRDIATLLNEKMAAGEHVIQWNGGTYPAGIYFYRLEASSIATPGKTYVQTSKMVLIR